MISIGTNKTKQSISFSFRNPMCKTSRDLSYSVLDNHSSQLGYGDLLSQINLLLKMHYLKLPDQLRWKLS